MSVEFGIQKAKHLFLEMDKKNPAINHDYLMFEKHDGWYGYIDFPACTITSRAHREIPAVTRLSNEIRKRRPDVRGRLIFEIMIEGMEVDSFHELNGILNRKSEEAEGVYLRVHDFIHNFHFCHLDAITRYNFAAEIVQRLGMSQVRLSPILGISKAPLDWYQEAEKIQFRGGEGLILKQSNALYMPDSRVSSLMKIKEEVTVEMQVIKVIEGLGEHQGQAGKLICKDVAGQLHEIGMGCMKHDERKAILINPLEIINSVVEVKAMKKLKDGKFREPRFKARRYDKGVHELG